MSGISPLKMLGLARKYLNEERLLRDNPDVSLEALEAFFRRIARSLASEQQNVKTGGARSAQLPVKIHSTQPNSPGPSLKKLIVYSDGASKGNPGDAGAGFVIMTRDGSVVREGSRYLGSSTNNVAEYEGAIMGLEEAVRLEAEEVLLRADSELMVKQLTGVYKVKNPGLKPLYDRLVELKGRFTRFEVQHVPREMNSRADRLASSAATGK